MHTAACLTGFIIIIFETVSCWPPQSIYAVLGTKPRAFELDRQPSSRWATPSPIFTVYCCSSDTMQWFESNNSKNNLCDVSVRRDSRSHGVQFSDPHKAVLPTLRGLLLYKEYYRTGNVTGQQGACLVRTEPQNSNNQANKAALQSAQKKTSVYPN